MRVVKGSVRLLISKWFLKVLGAVVDLQKGEMMLNGHEEAAKRERSRS